MTEPKIISELLALILAAFRKERELNKLSFLAKLRLNHQQNKVSEQLNNINKI